MDVASSVHDNDDANGKGYKKRFSGGVAPLLRSIWLQHGNKIIFLILFTICLVVYRGSRHKKKVKWNPKLMFTTNQKHKQQSHGTCNKPMYIPFIEGCPVKCKDYRKDPILASKDEHRIQNPKYFRLSVYWALGQPNVYHDHGFIPDNDKFLAYDVGLNFQCNEAFVKAHTHTSKEISNQLNTIFPGPIWAAPRPVKTMVLDLMYLCCLTQEEAYKARYIIQQWLYKNYPFSIQVQFDQLQCWQTTNHMIQNLIIATTQTQEILMELEHNLRQTLQSNGIPINIERESQIPFHIQLSGLHFKDNSHKDITDTNELLTESIFKKLYNIIKPISDHMGQSWTGNNPMILSHPPQVEAFPITHSDDTQFVNTLQQRVPKPQKPPPPPKHKARHKEKKDDDTKKGTTSTTTAATEGLQKKTETPVVP